MAFEDWEFQKRITATWYYALQNCKYEILSQTLSRNNEKVLYRVSRNYEMTKRTCTNDIN